MPPTRRRQGVTELDPRARRAWGFGRAVGASFSLFRHFQAMGLLTSTRGGETETDRAGRLAEERVAGKYGGASGVEVYRSLRIPETGHRGRREIDLVVLSEKACYVVEVKNWSGTITIERDGHWLQTRKDGSSQKHANVVEETNHKAFLLESYIQRRGITLPPGFVQSKVVLVNPNSRPEQSIVMQPEVLVDENWGQLLEGPAGGLFGWLLKWFFPSNQSDRLDDTTHKQLRLILSTAPTWDRLELDGGRVVVGDFLKFAGRTEEIEALRVVKRSTVSNLYFSHRRGFLPNLLGLLVGYAPGVKVKGIARDYSGETSTFFGRRVKQRDTFEVEASQDLQIIFHLAGQRKSESIKINSVNAMSLST